MEETNRWEELNVDCLVNIFERVDMDDLLLSLPFVCKSWYQASLHPNCWKVLHFHKLINQQHSESMGKPSFTDRSQGSAIQVIVHPQFTREELLYISDECPSLKVLSLDPYYFPLDEVGWEFPSLVRKWKHLEHLHLEFVTIIFPLVETIEEIGRHCNNFVGFSASGCPMFYLEEVPAAIVTWFPKLKTLDLSRELGVNLSKKGLLMILEGCKELETLKVRESEFLKIDDEILKQASGVKNFSYEVKLDDPPPLELPIDLGPRFDFFGEFFEWDDFFD